MIALLWSGIVTGALYALGALGLVLIYKSTRVVNFGFGNQAALGAFVVFALLQREQPMPWVAAVAISCVVGLLVSALLCLAVFPIALRNDIGAVISTLGFGLILQGVTTIAFGTGTVSLQLPIGDGVMRVMGLVVTTYDLVVLGCAATLILGLWLIIERTKIGIAFRAVANHPEASQICGLSLFQVHLGSWIAASVLALASALLIVPTSYLSPMTVPTFMLQAFVAAAIGSFDSLPGAVVGGILIGILLNLFNYYVSPELANTFLVILVLGLLTVFPGGIMSRSVTGRV